MLGALRKTTIAIPTTSCHLPLGQAKVAGFMCTQNKRPPQDIQQRKGNKKKKKNQNA